MNLLLDSTELGQLCHPSRKVNQALIDWVEAILRCDSGDRVFLPEICDYEVRRKLMHLTQKGQSSPRSLERLDELGELLEFLPLDTAVMRQAAGFWAEARSRGNPTAAESALDGDVILAAQAAQVDGTIVTKNRRHLSQFVPARERTQIIWAYTFVCIRGPVDNLAIAWKDHFVIQDLIGRDWHCRREAVWNPSDETEVPPLLEQLSVDLEDVLPMYVKLFRSGFPTTDETEVRMPVTMRPTPISEQEMIQLLRAELAEDGAESTSGES